MVLVSGVEFRHEFTHRLKYGKTLCRRMIISLFFSKAVCTHASTLFFTSNNVAHRSGDGFRVEGTQSSPSNKYVRYQNTKHKTLHHVDTKAKCGDGVKIRLIHLVLVLVVMQ